MFAVIKVKSRLEPQVSDEDATTINKISEIVKPGAGQHLSQRGFLKKIGFYFK